MTHARARWLLVVVVCHRAWHGSKPPRVYYLRVMVDRLDPYQANPLPMHGILGQVELVREAATLVMLLTVGMLAGGRGGRGSATRRLPSASGTSSITCF